MKIKCFGLLLVATVLMNFTSAEPEVICYVDTSSDGGYQLYKKLQENVCTILNLAFSKVDANGRVLAENVPNLKSYTQFRGTAYAKKVLLSLGGAADWQTNQNFVKISRSPDLLRKFADSCLDVCMRHNFDGIDVDWEFPYAEDRAYFVELLRTLKEKLGPAGLLVTTAVGASNWWAVGTNGLDIPNVGKNVDFINLMTYDFHANAEWDRSFGLYFNAPLDDAPGRDSITNSLKIFLKHVPPHKLVVGIPLYGNAYTVSKSVGVRDSYSYGWPVMGVSPGYNEICTLNYFRVPAASPQFTPYMHNDRYWVSYEDPTSVAKKASLVEKYKLGGVMVWALEHDDYKGNCGMQPFPLMRAINKAVGRLNEAGAPEESSTTTPTTSTTTSTTTSKTPNVQTTTQSETPVREIKKIVICEKAGVFSYPGDCQKFYQCGRAGAKPYVQSCAANRKFNIKKRYCDTICVT